MRRARILTVAIALALATGGVLVTASPASAHCGGHGTHPDLYNAGGISFKDGTRIRAFPHTNCTILGLGYPNHGIDVHCATVTGSDWLYLRDTATGVDGWSRVDALDFAFTVFIQNCSNATLTYRIG